MSQLWLVVFVALVTIVCDSQVFTADPINASVNGTQTLGPSPVSDLEWRGQQILDGVPSDRLAYAVHKLNSSVLVMAYSGIFGPSGPAIRVLALTMDRNETTVSSQTLLMKNFTLPTSSVGNITSGLHMVYDQGDVALVYQDASRMCLQVLGLRPPPGNQPPPPPGSVPPPHIGGEASFPHISTISYPTSQRPYFSIVYSRQNPGPFNGTCIMHMYAGFDNILNTSLLYCPISPDSPMDPLAEIWYHPNNLDSFFIISRAGSGLTFEVQRCTGVTSGAMLCTGLLTGGNGITVEAGVDMVASRRTQNNQFWFGWRVNGIVSVISMTYNETSVSKVSNIYFTSLAADSFSFVDSLNPNGIALVIRKNQNVERQELVWNGGSDIQVIQSWQVTTNLEDPNGHLISTESLDSSVIALVSTASNTGVSLNYFAVPYCGNTLVSNGVEECELPMENCNSTCQCLFGVDPSGGCSALNTPSGVIPSAPSSAPSEGGLVGPVADTPNDKLIQTVVPAVVIPVVVVAVGVALLVVLLKRRNKSKKVKDDKIRLEPANYQAMPGANPTLPNDSKSSQAGSGEHVSIPIGLAPLNTMSSDERMKIPYSDLKVIREIGSGAYGKVFLGEWQMTQVALKVSGMTSSEEFIREAELLINLRPHPNVVQILGVSTDGLNVVMIMEYCDGGSLDHLIKGEVSMQTKIKYLSGIAKGIYHLHKNNIIHRDLAARNILLSRGEPKISDFGMSRKVQEAALHAQTRSTVGPLRWMAPESLKSAQYSAKSDVWSFGIMAWEVLTGKEPHLDSDPLAIGIEIRDKGLTPKIPEDINPELAQLMKDCWQQDPELRPDFAEICKRINRIL